MNGWALVRIDHFLPTEGKHRATLKAVFAGQSAAQSELDRLRQLHAGKDVEWVMLPASWESEPPIRGGFALLGVPRGTSAKLADRISIGGVYPSEAEAHSALACLAGSATTDWEVVVARYRPGLAAASK